LIAASSRRERKIMGSRKKPEKWGYSNSLLLPDEMEQEIA
jgi:hypothetical protein